MKNSQLTGILWHQGESDGMGGKHEKYYEKLHRIMQGFRKELEVPNLPIIIGGLGDFLGRSGFGKNCTEYTLINQKLKQFAFENDNCYFVDAAGLTCPTAFISMQFPKESLVCGISRHFTASNIY